MLKYLNVFPETKATVQRYKPADRCFLYEAMMDYAFTGEEPDWNEDDIKWYAWEFLKQAVDRADMVRENKAKAGKASAEQRLAEVNTSEQASTEVNTTQQAVTEGNSESESESESDTDTESKNKRVRARRDRSKEPEMFNQFWQAYPRKTAKQSAIAAFGKLRVNDELLKTMLDALEKQKSQWSDPQYVPYPATWLNGHRWEDEVVQTSTRKQTDRQVAQTNYDQREYEERKPGEIPEWLREELEKEAAG